MMDFVLLRGQKQTFDIFFAVQSFYVLVNTAVSVICLYRVPHSRVSHLRDPILPSC